MNTLAAIGLGLFFLALFAPFIIPFVLVLLEWRKDWK